MTRKWLEGAAGLRLETVTKSFTKRAGKRADELISGSLILTLQAWKDRQHSLPDPSPGKGETGGYSLLPPLYP